MFFIDRAMATLTEDSILKIYAEDAGLSLDEAEQRVRDFHQGEEISVVKINDTNIFMPVQELAQSFTRVHDYNKQTQKEYHEQHLHLWTPKP